MRADPEPRSIDRFMVSFTGHPEDPALSSEIAAIVGIRAHPPDFYSDVPHLEAGDDDTLGQTARGDHADHLIQAIRAIRHRQREVRSMHDADQDLTRDLALFERPESRRADTGARSNTVRNEPEDGRHTLSETPPYRASIRLRPPPSPPSPLHVPESPALDFERDLREYRRQAARLANNRRLRLGSHRSIRLVDGLGDRDRSLSPEGDGVWDTLQSTLTPDPQPPSVGSSFASTTASTAASTAASQNPTVPSSRTSITSPGEDVEPPCDPVNEPEGFLEGGEDVEAPEPDRPRRSNPHGRLSYAEAALSGSGSPTGDPEWLPGMHHIIRRLAARQDIPDEWWQQAGLSRSMSWESSN
ncbi:hypothetical protein F5Y13DRAFT_149072 [Hypoxylon sp. FL1857]|nr:hypothetical protein F5Y13DRAFT_149072 [Hypoxylon sp. FL1857]